MWESKNSDITNNNQLNVQGSSEGTFDGCAYIVKVIRWSCRIYKYSTNWKVAGVKKWWLRWRGRVWRMQHTLLRPILATTKRIFFIYLLFDIFYCGYQNPMSLNFFYYFGYLDKSWTSSHVIIMNMPDIFVIYQSTSYSE